MADNKDRKTSDTGHGAGTGSTGGAGNTGARTGGNDQGSTGSGLSSMAQGLMDRAGDVAGQAREKVQEWAGDARDAVSHAGEKARAWAGDAYEGAADRIGDFGNEVTSLIRKHPLPALLIGFGIGLLLGRTARMI